MLDTAGSRGEAPQPDRTDISSSPKRAQEAAKSASIRLSDGVVHGAVRMLCSEDMYVNPNAQTFDVLKDKHPSKPLNRRHDPPQTVSPLTVNVEDVLATHKSFIPGSAAGVDSLRPQHITNMLGLGANGT